jgi:hypothetical protein
MPLENAQYINQLNDLWPLGTDGLNASDDHHRVIKQAAVQSFPNIGGEVTATEADLNTLTGAATLGSGLNPVGTVIMGAYAFAPDGYLQCNGSAIDPQYAALIAIVGANTPDLRGQFIRGWTTGGGQSDPDGPRAPLDEQNDAFQSHDHTVNLSEEAGTASQARTGSSNTPDSVLTELVGGDETRPVNTTLFFAIKW